MKFFRREPEGSSGGGQAGGEDTGAIIAELTQLVVGSMREVPLERDTLELLQLGLVQMIQRDCSKEAVLAGQTAARLGYLSRSAEFATFESAEGTDPQLAAALDATLREAESSGSDGYDALGELAAELAAGESVDAARSEGGPSWTLPGLDGDMRRRLRDHQLRGVPVPRDLHADDLRRAWKYGYFLRALDEMVEEDRGPA